MNEKDKFIYYTYIPTDNNKNKTPNPRNSDANKLIKSSLKITPSLKLPFGRDTSKTKNHAVKNVPMARSTVAKCGNTVGFIGEIYLVIVSIFACKKKNKSLVMYAGVDADFMKISVNL